MPEPSVVLLLEMVGSGLILQQIPLAITVAPPSEETLPPVYPVKPMMLIGEVVIVGSDKPETNVLNETSFP